MRLMCAVLVALVALGGCGQDNEPIGASCTSNDECASGACSPTILGAHAQSCHCAQDSDCPSGLVCRSTIDTGLQCQHPADAGP